MNKHLKIMSIKNVMRGVREKKKGNYDNHMKA